MVKRMYLEEMINAEYSRLNENDILIWQYIQLNKRECCEIAIEDLAQKVLHFQNDNLQIYAETGIYRFP